jgi:hypothetical protein
MLFGLIKNGASAHNPDSHFSPSALAYLLTKEERVLSRATRISSSSTLDREGADSVEAWQLITKNEMNAMPLLTDFGNAKLPCSTLLVSMSAVLSGLKDHVSSTIVVSVL